MESIDAKLAQRKSTSDYLYSEAGAYFETTKHRFILKSNGHAAWIVH